MTLLCRSFVVLRNEYITSSVSEAFRGTFRGGGSKKDLRVLKELGGLRAPFGDWRRKEVAWGSLMVIPGLVMPFIQLQYVAQIFMEFG